MRLGNTTEEEMTTTARAVRAAPGCRGVGFVVFTLRTMACVGGKKNNTRILNHLSCLSSLTLLQVPLVVPRLLVLSDELLHPAGAKHRSGVNFLFPSSPEMRSAPARGSTGSDKERRRRQQPRRRCNPFRQFGHRSTCVPKPLASTS